MLDLGGGVRGIRVLRVRAPCHDLAATSPLAVDRRRVRLVLRGPAGVDLLRFLAGYAASLPLAGRPRLPRHLRVSDRGCADAGPRATDAPRRSRAGSRY